MKSRDVSVVFSLQKCSEVFFLGIVYRDQSAILSFVTHQIQGPTTTSSQNTQITITNELLIGNMLWLFQPLFERFPSQRLRQGFYFLMRLPGNLFRPSAFFSKIISRLEELLKTHDDTFDAVTLALNELNSFSPRVHLIPRGVWPKESANRFCNQTHLKSTFADAVNLLKGTRREVLLCSHAQLWWSATYLSI